jgi:hypothetical protein
VDSHVVRWERKATMGHERELEPKLRELSDALQDLADDQGFEELFEIIHRPGWTTPAELEFFTGIVETITAQARALTALKGTLVLGSSRVELNPQPLPP